jgi:hypothetical protein
VARIAESNLAPKQKALCSRQNRPTGIAISPPRKPAATERLTQYVLLDAARDFDVFYQQRSVATAAGSILVAAVDGKGIPMVKPCGAHPTARLAKGQKANKKRMAGFIGLPFVRNARA